MTAIRKKSAPARAASSLARLPRVASVARVDKETAPRKAGNRGTRRGGCVLVVVRPRRPSSVWALGHARALARSEGTPMLFLCVLPPLQAAGGAASRRELETRTVERVSEWLARRGGVPPNAKVLVRVGVETTEAARIARAIEASVVIVGVRTGAGGEWLAVARDARLPVLLARPPGRSREIVAASDFSADGLPTLGWAIRTAIATDARVTLVHNVDPRGRALSRGLGLPLPRAAVSDVRDARLKKMQALAQRSPVECTSILLEEEDSVEAVAGVVAKKTATLLVVGTHGRAKRDTANRLLTRVRSSVLVVPLEPT